EFHLFYRHLDPAKDYSVFGDIKTVGELFHSAQNLRLVLLATVGCLFLAGTCEWKSEQRAEFRLCAWLSGGMAIYLASAKPTYACYFILVIPFLAMLATVGAVAVCSRIWIPRRPGWAVILILGFYALVPARLASTCIRTVSRDWARVEEIAAIVDRVTPRDG